MPHLSLAVVLFFFAIAGSGYAADPVQVADYVRANILGGDFDDVTLWMTDEALDETHVARDRDLDVPDLPFPLSPKGAPTWLVMIDDHPLANWSHDARWVFVSDDLDWHSEILFKDMPPTVWSDFGFGLEMEFACMDVTPMGCEPERPAEAAADMALPLDFPLAEERCLHTVLISGGINDRNNHARYAKNLQAMYSKLNSLGYKAGNTSVYYADGNKEIKVGDTNIVTGGAKKADIRAKIKGHCTNLNPKKDILFIYVSNHGAKNGAIHLWDENGDGKNDPGELYSVEEFAEDTKDCKVCRLYVIMDQCYSGAHAATAGSGNHENLTIYTAAKADEPSICRIYMNYWHAQDASATNINAMHDAVATSMAMAQKVCIRGDNFCEVCQNNDDCPGGECKALSDVGVANSTAQSATGTAGQDRAKLGDCCGCCWYCDDNNQVVCECPVTEGNCEHEWELGGDCDGEGQCGECEPACEPCENTHCPGDLPSSQDGVVNGFDLLGLLSQWGPCPSCPGCEGDIDCNGVVDGFDLLALLGQWGPCPPPPPIGACCFGGECADALDPPACAAFGGTYMGDGTVCDVILCHPGIDPYTCVGLCGGMAPGGCFCDGDCCAFLDCCNDYEDVCDDFCDPGIDPYTCEGFCGGMAPSGCWCYDDCFVNPEMECCDDIFDWCKPVIDPYTCEGFCGGMAPGGCWCDDWCFEDPDVECCDDIFNWCDLGFDPYTCVGICGGMAPGGCFCDADCCAFLDCCDDYEQACKPCPPEPDPMSCLETRSCGGIAPGGCSCQPNCWQDGTCCADACEACPCTGACCTTSGACHILLQSQCNPNFGNVFIGPATNCGQCSAGPGSCVDACGIDVLGCSCRPTCVAQGNCCPNACVMCGHCPP